MHISLWAVPWLRGRAFALDISLWIIIFSLALVPLEILRLLATHCTNNAKQILNWDQADINRSMYESSFVNWTDEFRDNLDTKYLFPISQGFHVPCYEDFTLLASLSLLGWNISPVSDKRTVEKYITGISITSVTTVIGTKSCPAQFCRFVTNGKLLKVGTIMTDSIVK